MRKLRWLLTIYALLWLTAAGTAAAVEFIQAEDYFVPAETVINDDLYVSATNVTIDGRIEGDLIVLGSYVEINGTVTGDLLVVAAGVVINGEVGDDARLLVGSSRLTGRVGDDFLSTGSGGQSLPLPLQSGDAALEPGIFIVGGDIGGDAALFGGTAEISGAIGGELTGTINTLQMREMTVRRGASLELLNITVDETSRVEGENGFYYTAPVPLSVPSTLSPNIVYEEVVQENGGIDWFTGLRQILGAIAGFALLGWFVMRYRPNWLFEPVTILSLEPFRCFMTGFVVVLAFLFIPVLTVLLMVATGFFWGIGVGLAVGGFIVLALVMIWIFSPLIVGMWIGRRFSSQPFGALLFGIVLITIFRFVPLIGLGVSALVFMAAVGALIMARPLQPIAPQV